ncbi:MAG: UPF0149 family protein [Gammaproteobacteria bacterium]|nr:UPF0149 family protein [Gammaproteobacteria bacterium]
MSSAINSKQIQFDLVTLGIEQSPSEVHGTLCGVLCAKSDINLYEWLSLTLLDKTTETEIAQSINNRDLLLEAIGTSFKEFFVSTVMSLSDSNLNFHPLLVDDESILHRLQAIAQWSQGFLMGLSLGGIKHFSTYSDEVSEFIEAMTSLSNADEYDLAENDSDEEAIIEFTEFIRVGVLLINEEINPIRQPIQIMDS